LKAADFLAGCARNARVSAIADNLHGCPSEQPT
jgi:hypothetical protein